MAAILKDRVLDERMTLSRGQVGSGQLTAGPRNAF